MAQTLSARLQNSTRLAAVTVLKVRGRASSLLVACALLSSLSSLPAQPVRVASSQSGLRWEVSNDQAAAAAVDYSFSHTTATAGIVKTITVTASGVGLRGTPAIMLTDGVGAGAVTIAGQVITYSLTSAVDIPAGVPIFLQFSGLTNPGAGVYTTTLATKTTAGATIDGGTSQSVSFATDSIAKAIVVERGLTFTVATTPIALTMDPTVRGLAAQSFTVSISVLTNAHSGYTLAVCDQAADTQSSASSHSAVPPRLSATGAAAVTRRSPSTREIGYTVAGTGVGDPGFSINPALAGGAMYTSRRSSCEIVAQSATPTGQTANTITITHHATIDLATQASDLTDTFSDIVTINYS